MKKKQMNLNNLPEAILKITLNQKYHIDNIGMTDSNVLVYDDMVLKIEETKTESNHEYIMLKWLQDKLPVPKILAFVQENGYNYLLLSKVDGYMAFEEPVAKDPVELVKILANGIKALWDIDIRDCPVKNGLDQKFIQAQYNIDHDLCEILDTDPDIFKFNDFQELLDWLKLHRVEEDFVLSHGDFCLPNIFIKDHQITGYIDLGRSGIADKWQDIALCIRSLRYNLEEKFKLEYIDLLLAELNVVYDQFKIDYYMMLDELS